MPLSRTNSCVDIDFTLRRTFKKANFRCALTVVNHEPLLMRPEDHYSAKSSRQP
jgi:hypothetical protein